MNAKDIDRFIKIATEVLTKDQRGKLFRADGKKLNADDIQAITYALRGRLEYFLEDGNKPRSRAPLPGQLSLSGEVVGLPEPDWDRGFCPTCGGLKTVPSPSGYMPINCQTCGGAGDEDEWKRRREGKST